MFWGTGKEERIPFLLGSVEAQPTGRYVQTAAGGEEAAQQPSPAEGEGQRSAGASVTRREASPLRSWDLTATSNGQGLQKSPAGSSKANLPSTGIGGETQWGKRLRSKRAASDLHPLPERRAAASLMCFESPQPALFILQQQTHTGEHHITPVSRDMLQHWPSNLRAPGTSGRRAGRHRALALPGPHT